MISSKVSEGKLYEHCKNCNVKLRVKASNPFCSQSCVIKSRDERLAQKLTLEKFI